MKLQSANCPLKLKVKHFAPMCQEYVTVGAAQSGATFNFFKYS